MSIMYEEKEGEEEFASNKNCIDLSIERYENESIKSKERLITAAGKRNDNIKQMEKQQKKRE